MEVKGSHHMKGTQKREGRGGSVAHSNYLTFIGKLVIRKVGGQQNCTTNAFWSAQLMQSKKSSPKVFKTHGIAGIQEFVQCQN